MRSNRSASPRNSVAHLSGSKLGSAAAEKSGDWCSTREELSVNVMMPLAASRRMASQVGRWIHVRAVASAYWRAVHMQITTIGLAIAKSVWKPRR